MKNTLNLILVLSLTLVVGLSFFSTGAKASAHIMSNPEPPTCMDIPPDTKEGNDIVRVCGAGSDCPWTWITIPQEATIGECTP